MNVNFYKKHQIKASKSVLPTETSVLFLDYLESFLFNSSTKRVQGYGTVGLAHNTVRTYKTLYRIVKHYELDTSEKLYLVSFDKYTSESFTHYLKIEKQYSDNYCGQLLKLLKIILRDAEKSGFAIHPYSNYIESFKQKSSDRILHILNPEEITAIKMIEEVPEEYLDSYKWLLIGLCIGQRVSDLLALSHSNIRKAPTGLYIDILQQKTHKAVTI